MFHRFSALLAVTIAALAAVTVAAPESLKARGGFDCDTGKSAVCCGGFDDDVRDPTLFIV